MTPDVISRFLDLMTETAVSAGRTTLTARQNGLLEKAADKAAEKQMLSILAQMSHIPVISEEAPHTHQQCFSSGLAFMIDPIDGTSAFDRGAAEFVNCIALLQDGDPVAGVICAPCQGFVTRGDVVRSRVEELTLSQHLRGITSARVLQRVKMLEPAVPRRAVIGQSELTLRMMDRLTAMNVGTLGILDSAICFSHLVRGDADVFVRLAPSMEWDIAAGHALVKALGGDVYDLENRPIRYGKPGLRNEGFVATTVPLPSWRADL